MSTTLRGASRRCTGIILAALAAACLDDRPVAPGPNDDASPVVGLGFQATILGAAAGQTVHISAYYRRLDGTNVPLSNSPAEVSVTPGVPQRVAVVVRIGPCLADPQHAGGSSNGCEVGIDLALEDEDGNVIDEQSSPPTPALPPGTTTTIPQPITFAPVAQVSFAAAVLREGESRTLTASATDAQGNAVASRTFKWASDNPGVLSINATTGAVTAVAAGSARVTATTGIRSTTVTVRVIRRVASIVITPNPAPPVLAAGALSLVATPKALNGVDAGDPADRTIVWSVVNPAGATPTARVSTNGTVTGAYPGDADVTVSVDGVTSTVRLRVNAASIGIQSSGSLLLVGTTMPLKADVLAADDAVLPNVPVTWSTSNPAVATVDANGVVTGVGQGLATITATGGGASGTTPVHVTTLALDIQPALREILSADTARLSATNAAGPVTWETSDAQVATVSSTGLVTGRVPGTAIITATAVSSFGIQRGTVTIVVKAATLEISPQPAQMYAYETLQFTATARDTKGAILDVPITWSSGNPQLAQISVNGLVFGYGATVTTIGATGGGQEAVASLTILQGSGLVVPSRSSVLPGKTLSPATRPSSRQ